jgi:hypothetical protein
MTARSHTPIHVKSLKIKGPSIEIGHAVIQVSGGNIVSGREDDLSFPLAKSFFQNVGFQGFVLPILWRITAKSYRCCFGVAVFAVVSAPVQAVFIAVGSFLCPKYRFGFDDFGFNGFWLFILFKGPQGSIIGFDKFVQIIFHCLFSFMK